METWIFDAISGYFCDSLVNWLNCTMNQFYQHDSDGCAAIVRVKFGIDDDWWWLMSYA